MFDVAQYSLVRFSLKDLERDFAQTEEDIKAVQSVGQIIGEVMKQLDDERCELNYNDSPCVFKCGLGSHCESIFGTSICCVLPTCLTSP
jgi:hypothetical protein